ncbi:MAG TPA: tetratricopeptide repeat protein, partial [Chthoniobacterales bacterium]
LLMQGKMEGAARMFERASAINPDDYQAPCLLISVYRSLGRERESENAARRGIALAERAMQLNPDDPRPAHLGISALIFLGEHERAREWMNRALAIDPDDPTTLYNVACGYSNLGELDRALDLLQRLIPLGGPGWFDWIEHDSDLDPLRNQPRYAALREMMKDAQTTL